MTTNTTQTNSQLRNVLEELSMASPVPDREILDRFVRRYPQFASELTNFAVELALDAIHDDESHEKTEAKQAPDVSPEVATAMSRLHNRLHAVRKAAESRKPNSQHDPFSGLSGDRMKSLVRRIRANPVLVMKLRDRLIEPTTIPAELTRLAADELGVSIGVMQAYWAGPPVIRQASSYQSNQKPEVSKRQSFEQAVTTAQLPSEDQAYLLAL